MPFRPPLTREIARLRPTGRHSPMMTAVAVW